MHLLDTSNLSQNHPFFTHNTTTEEKNQLLIWQKKNTKQIGVWKFESGNRFILRFLALKAKIYSIYFSDDEVMKKMKGCVKQVLKNIEFDEFVKCYMNPEKYKLIYEQTNIRSKHHQMIFETRNKEIANSFENKRFWTNNNQSYAIGSKFAKDYKIIEDMLDEIVNKIELL